MSVATNELAPPALDGETVARELFHNIRALAEHVRNTLDAAFAELESLTELVIRAHDDRAWRYINHLSWEDCCKKEFGAIRLVRLPREMRKQLHLALRDAGLSVRHTAAVTGCSKNTVLEDCPSEKVSQTGTPDSDSGKYADVLAMELIGAEAKKGRAKPVADNIALADSLKSNVEHLNARFQPRYGTDDLMSKVAGAARAVSGDLANLVSLVKLARRDGTVPTELAEYLGPKVDTWISTLGSLVEDAAAARSVAP